MGTYRTPRSVLGKMESLERCICCKHSCGDVERKEFYDRFKTFALRRETEWLALSTTPPLPPGHFNFLGLPREIRDTIYNLLVKEKEDEEAEGPHYCVFPTQLLYLNKQIRDEFLDELIGSGWITCKYPIWERHFQLDLPPPTLFPRVKWLYARFLMADTHAFAIPSWTQVLHDAELWLKMFPNLRGAKFVFLCVHKDQQAVIESDVVEAWENSGLCDEEKVLKVHFDVVGPRVEVVTHTKQVFQRQKRLVCLRTNSSTPGSRWWKRVSSGNYPQSPL
ncbi:hypothetical protein BDV96DRAFT_585038 [Lophiotrema nucula]|uniref:Uncharacterized protein n=1 Tax=Lophiotrema nucula TaxID=690887 RepID=A0A6A5YU52_9PLEO|nr:hypothetical protein BDV96DRAFT_585038 [Lophiotrema nucula]